MNRCDTMAGISEAQRMQLTVQQVRGETWKDLVEIPYQWRTDSKGNHIHRGTICKMKGNGKSRYVIVVGLKDPAAVIGLDLNLREAFDVKDGRQYDFEFFRASWVGQLLFGWAASDPAYRIPAQLSLISLFLGTFLGMVGLILGSIPLYEEKYGPLFRHQSNVSSAAPSPGSPSPEAK